MIVLCIPILVMLLLIGLLKILLRPKSGIIAYIDILLLQYIEMVWVSLFSNITFPPFDLHGSAHEKMILITNTNSHS